VREALRRIGVSGVVTVLALPCLLLIAACGAGGTSSARVDATAANTVAVQIEHTAVLPLN
jgi:hypothetical protein